MFYSIRGKVSVIGNKFIVIESSNIGYDIFVSKPDKYVVGQEIYLYLHHHIKEDNEYLVGFESQEEKDAFDILLHVNGIGPKSAISILSKTNYNQLLIAISENNIDFISAIPGISERTASQIVLDLKEYIARSNKDNGTVYKGAREALKALKFKSKEIDKVLSTIYIPNVTKEQLVKEALRRLDYARNN